MLSFMKSPRPQLLIAGLVVVVGGALTTFAIDDSAAETRAFWSSVQVAANEAEHYDSVAEMRDAADAVVLGSVTDVIPGRLFSGFPDDNVQYVTAFVQVDRVLKGDLRTDGSGRLLLEVMLPNRFELDAIVAATPRSQSVFFLRHKGTELANLGAPADIVADELFYRLVILRGVVWSDAGKAAVFPGGHADFLTVLAGRPFNEVVLEATK